MLSWLGDPDRRRLVAGALLGLLAVLAVALTRGPEPPSESAAGAFSFAAFGDAPYNFLEDLRYRIVLQDLEAHDLAFAIHVGDLFSGPCTVERYQRSLGEFNSLRHPVIYTPGDNEWTDCGGAGGGFYPLDRLDRIREIFFEDPAESLGGRSLRLEHQGADPQYSEFVENARWTHEGILFATVHLVGSWNARASFRGRTERDDEASLRRTDAAVAWLRETFAEAAATDAVAVVIAFHADLALDSPVDEPRRLAFEPFVEALEMEVEQFGQPVLAVHGDWHDYIVDQPLTSRSSGRQLKNLTRLQVPGSFDVGWVRVTVRPDSADPFAFESRVVPPWKHW